MGIIIDLAEYKLLKLMKEYPWHDAPMQDFIISSGKLLPKQTHVASFPETYEEESNTDKSA